MSSQILLLDVVRIERQTADAVVIVLKSPENAILSFLPGQFLTFRIPIEGQMINRSYSICSVNSDLPEISVAVKEVAGGLMSTYLNRQLQVGQKLEVISPMGNFTCPANLQGSRHIVLFGAGSGITPLYSILRTILAEESSSRISLIYANEDAKSEIFRTELDRLALNHADRFRLIRIYRNPDSQSEFQGMLNTTMAIHMLGLIQASTEENTLYYMCGPVGFMDVVKQSLQDMGILSSRIFRESFTAPALGDSDAAIANEPIITRNVKVLFNKKEYQFDVTPQDSILMAALDKGIHLPYSCQGGVCTACRGKLKTGRVHLDEREGLSDSEIEDGYVLCCVGHPLTDDVLIEIG
jgi:ring-1,2-phenylacetyl-CoA epoxidase subunit PaaE